MKENEIIRSHKDEITTQLNKILSEKMNKKENMRKEAISTGNNSDLFTKHLSDMLNYVAMDDEKTSKILNLAPELILNGSNSIQLPVLEKSMAVTVSEGSVIAYANDTTRSLTVAPQKIAMGTKITWEMMKILTGGMIQNQEDYLNKIIGMGGDSIKVKLQQDILNGLYAGASGTTVALGSTPLDKFHEAIKNLQDSKNSEDVPYDFIPNVCVLTPTAYMKLKQDDDFKTTIKALDNGRTVYTSDFINMDGLDIIVSPNLTTSGAAGFVMDTRYAANLVKMSELETYDGRLPQSPDTEVIQLMSYALAVTYPKAIVPMTIS